MVNSIPEMITRDFLRANPNHIFVYGDNNRRQGHGGAAALRDEPNTYGFITKIAPNNDPTSFYMPEQYKWVYDREITLFLLQMKKDKVYLISKLGAGLANRYGIFEHVIEPMIKPQLNRFDNVVFLW